MAIDRDALPYGNTHVSTSSQTGLDVGPGRDLCPASSRSRLAPPPRHTTLDTMACSRIVRRAPRPLAHDAGRGLATAAAYALGPWAGMGGRGVDTLAAGKVGALPRLGPDHAPIFTPLPNPDPTPPDAQTRTPAAHNQGTD